MNDLFDSDGAIYMGSQRDPAGCRVGLFGVPYDGTTSFRPGTRFGPAAIREVSPGLESYCPQHQRFQAKAQDRFGGLLHGGDHRLGGAKGDVHGAEVGDGQLLEIPVELGAVALQARADLADGGWPKAGPRPEGGGAVIGHPK